MAAAAAAATIYGWAELTGAEVSGGRYSISSLSRKKKQGYQGEMKPGCVDVEEGPGGLNMEGEPPGGGAERRKTRGQPAVLTSS